MDVVHDLLMIAPEADLGRLAPPVWSGVAPANRCRRMRERGLARLAELPDCLAITTKAFVGVGVEDPLAAPLRARRCGLGVASPGST